MRSEITRRAALGGLAGVTLAGAVARPALAGADEEKIQSLVDEAAQAAKRFVGAVDVVWLKQNIGTVKGVLILPHLVKGGFIFGGSGGSGVLLGKDPDAGVWSYPAFYTMGSGTFGLQIGVEVSEIVLMIMTERGMDRVLSTSFKLGGDVSVAAGPVGVGAKAQTADVLAFSRTKGLYGGLNLEGAVIATRERWNRRYYGRDVTVSDIVVRRTAANPGADELRRTVAAMGK